MKHVDLYSGIGGFSLGFERAGIETIAFCEIDPWAQKVLAKHWPDVPLCRDIKDFPNWWKKQNYPESEDYIVTAGFPCQPFSVAGEKLGVEDDRWLWPETAEAIRAVRPKYVLLENVANIVNFADAFGTILGDLSGLGYDAEWGVISADRFGAPQERKRLIVLSYPNSKYGEPLDKLGTGEEYSQIARFPGPTRNKSWALQDAWRKREPAVRRVVDGVSDRLVRDQLRGLGNAVIPQISEYYARAILHTEARGIL